ncbi:hypothetical protein E2562_025962 [Oryza meyeriana var. granulata]|uniref:Uncharacterized protein n=1 Tax=Oryza meyeriana var. granulata TaxID=110450 RepID=A0A6G1EYS7_9ORYZ|nr:hypothetical protein E2562_025962 [Oryza meyeriana var. granulata]
MWLAPGRLARSARSRVGLGPSAGHAAASDVNRILRMYPIGYPTDTILENFALDHICGWDALSSRWPCYRLTKNGLIQKFMFWINFTLIN